MFRRSVPLLVASAWLAIAVGARSGETPLPTISGIRAVPTNFSVVARDLTPLETGWSWTQRPLHGTDRIRTTIEYAAGTEMPPAGLPAVFWARW